MLLNFDQRSSGTVDAHAYQLDDDNKRNNSQDNGE